jgi:acetate kinase
VKALISLNAGSSSIKFSLFTLDDGLHLNAHGQIEKIGLAPPCASTMRRGGRFIGRHGATPR